MLWTGSTVRRRWRLISGNMLWKEYIPTRDSAKGPNEVSTGTVPLRSRGRADQSDITDLPSERASLNRSDGTSVSNAGITLASSKQAERLEFLKDSKESKTSLESSSGKTSDGPKGRQPLVLGLPEKAVPDWTVAEPKGVLTEHMKFARSVDWAATPLGPMHTWSRELRQVANLCMGDPHPASM